MAGFGPMRVNGVSASWYLMIQYRSPTGRALNYTGRYISVTPIRIS
jgi:hypothetical protein